MDKEATTEKRKRAPVRYWRIINGNLYARLQYQDETGKWREKVRPLTDKRQARRLVEEMRQELEKHGEEALQSDRMTFNQLADAYEKVEMTEARYSNGIKVSGKQSLQGLRTHLKPLVEHFGRNHIRTIRPTDVQVYKTKRLETPVEIEIKVSEETTDTNGKKRTSWRKETVQRERKIASVNRELELLRAMLNFAIRNEWLISNPFGKLKGIISKASEIERDRILSIEEEERLLAVCQDRRAHLRPLLICALDTAMRRGEMFKMRWCDVNFATGEIFIPRANTKTKEARKVGMTPRLRNELAKLKETAPANENTTVFGISNTIKTAWGTVRKLAKVHGFRLHDCRHTATTRMIAAGCAHTEVMKITGHSQLKTFLRYLNITPDTARNIAQKLDSYLSEKSAMAPAITAETIQ